MARTSLTAGQAAIVGRRIREFRIHQGLQQKDLVEGEFSKSYISLIESGRVPPSPRILESISRRLGVAVEQLLGAENGGQPLPLAAPSSDNIILVQDVIAEARLRLWQGLPQEALEKLQRTGKSHSSSEKHQAQIKFLAGQAQMMLGEAAQGLICYEQARQLAHQANDPEIEILALEQTGQHYLNTGLYLKAVTPLAAALEILNKNPVQDTRLKQRLNASLGNCYYKLKNTDRAFDYYQTAITTGDQTTNLLELAGALISVSEAYKERHNPAAAHEYINDGLTLYEADSDLKGIVEARVVYGRLLFEQGKFEQSEQHLTAALEMSLKIESHKSASLAMVGLAKLAEHFEKYDEAINYANQALSEAEVAGDALTSGLTLAQMATICLRRGENEKATGYFTQSIERLSPLRANKALGEIYYDYGQALTRLGRSDEALAVLSQAYKLQAGMETGLV